LHRKIFRKKEKYSYSTWAEPVGSTRSASAQPQAHASPSGPGSQGWPGQATAPSACVPHTLGAPPPRLFKAEHETKLSHALLASHRLHLCRAAGAKNRRRRHCRRRRCRRRLAASSRHRAVTGVSPSRERTGQVARRHWSSSFSPHRSTAGWSRHLPEVRDIELRTELRSSLSDVHRTAMKLPGRRSTNRHRAAFLSIC
jgi:hypothetical protein